MPADIVIIDYGMGNLRSVRNRFWRLGKETLVSSDKQEIMKANKLVLPGVGHFANGMKNLRESGMIEILKQKVIVEHCPILGICLGMQLLTEFSEEGDVAGLGFIRGRTIRFRFNNRQHKIPHMGWNTLTLHKESPLFQGVTPEDIYYFVHSYYVVCDDKEDIVTTTTYGITFTSALQRDTIYGTQFHPEKSHDCGNKLLKNFLLI
jgi:imidazole glycerol-phosphate synthase subunit HisH